MLKRLLDIIIAGCALIASIPFWVAISAAILLYDGWPVIYSQARVGKSGHIFYLFKFRSMIKNAERFSGPVLAEENDPRITPIGRILRKTALDEIPQLINIFTGNMSWVGPRPERPEFVIQYAREIPNYMQRHALRPGLTGVAQVYGRYHTDVLDKLPYDLYYVQHHNLILDFHLFVRSWLITARGKWDTAAGTER